MSEMYVDRITRMKEAAKRGAAWFDAVSVGSLISCMFFWAQYNEWKPLVWTAAVVASIKIIQNFIRVMGDV